MKLSKIIISNSEEFQKIIKTFEDVRTNICEIFESEKKNIEHINKTPTWSGPTQEKVYDKYLQFQKNFTPIEDALQVYINFLKKTLEDYSRLENTINRNIDELSDNLDVN